MVRVRPDFRQSYRRLEAPLLLPLLPVLSKDRVRPVLQLYSIRPLTMLLLPLQLRLPLRLILSLTHAHRPLLTMRLSTRRPSGFTAIVDGFLYAFIKNSRACMLFSVRISRMNVENYLVSLRHKLQFLSIS